MEQPSLFDTEPLLLTIPEAAHMLAIGRTLAVRAIAAGELEVVHINRASCACRSTQCMHSSSGDGPATVSASAGSVRPWRRSVGSTPPRVSATRCGGDPHRARPSAPGASTRWSVRRRSSRRPRAAQSRGIAYDPTGGRIPFRRYAEQWLEGRSLAATTRDNYAETLERHVYPTFGATPIGRLTPDEVRRWHRPLRERIPSTASRAYRIMHAILATAVEDDLIPRNPCRIKGAGSDPHTERPFVPAEVVLALADIAHARIRPMILVAGFAGLRYGELRALRLRSYDRLHGTLTVRESIDKRSRRKTTKTDSSQRTVTLPRFVLDAIDAHLTNFVSGDPDDPLFPGEAGGIISDGWFQREWRAARSALGLDEVHFHDLRHAAGTIATQQGATMREVMARLGHSTTSAAIRYQKAAADRDRALAERLDELVDGLRTSANADDSGPDPADRPAGARGFRGRTVVTSASTWPGTEESPAVAGGIRSTPNGIRTRAATLRGDRQQRPRQRRAGRSMTRIPLRHLGSRARAVDLARPR
ncbi:MAG: site-specific integrase [Microthrixaceae bacterium]|nr:site-specific integrase [Microthrixaceae bacterium]